MIYAKNRVVGLENILGWSLLIVKKCLIIRWQQLGVTNSTDLVLLLFINFLCPVKISCDSYQTFLNAQGTSAFIQFIDEIVYLLMSNSPTRASILINENM